jgi:hypothetical protein
MKKSRFAVAISTLVLVAAVFAFGSVVTAKGPSQGDPKDPIVLKAKKGDVSFSHAKHKSASCKKCHHKAKDGKTEISCHTCHTKKKGDAPTAKKAFHGSCKGCHKKDKKGPTGCKGCHKK